MLDGLTEVYKNEDFLLRRRAKLLVNFTVGLLSVIALVVMTLFIVYGAARGMRALVSLIATAAVTLPNLILVKGAGTVLLPIFSPTTQPLLFLGQ